MADHKEGTKILKALVNKLGVKNVTYRLHLSLTYVYLWFKGEDLESRRSPVEMVDELIAMAIVDRHYKEILDLLNHFNSQLFGGRYAPEDLFIAEVISNLQTLKKEALKNGK